MLATLSPDGVVREVSEGCRELLDLAPGALEGTRAADLVHPGDSATSVAAMTRLQRGDERAAVTVRLRRADGAWRWADAQLLAVHDGGGLAAIHATIRDVHARAEAERAQADAEARFRTAFEEAPIGMAIAALDGRFLQVNRALCAITGREQEELEGTPLVRLLHPEDREDEAEALARLARGDRESVARRAALAARRRQDRLDGDERDARARRRRRARSTCCCRSRTSPSAAATRPSCATSPTTTRSPACSTAARSRASSRPTSSTCAATARPAPR